MALLHIVNKSPFERNSLSACLRMAKEGSGILLIEDGVIAAADGTRFSAAVKDAMKGIKVSVLGPDLDARGISRDKVIDGISVVDYGGFVDLVAEFDCSQSWV
jgi:tRNA 2-thiouridine synthesizing protein B